MGAVRSKVSVKIVSRRDKRVAAALDGVFALMVLGKTAAAQAGEVDFEIEI